MDTDGGGTANQGAQKIINIGNIENANTTNNNTYVEAPKEKWPINEYLTEKLFVAIAPYCDAAQTYLEEEVNDIPGWSSKSKYSGPAKQLLGSNYAGVLGDQLLTLMAIGAENNSIDQLHRYIDNCIITGKTTIQVICFALLSDLWNNKTQTDIILSTEGIDLTPLNSFFRGANLNIQKYTNLLTCLLSVYEKNELELPIPDLKDFVNKTDPDSPFAKASKGLYDIGEMDDAIRDTPQNCNTTELHLTGLLTTFSFLAAYKMVSIKNIGYEKVGINDPRYLQSYMALGDKTANANALKMNYTESSVNSDCVLLYKGSDYLGDIKINLFPFFIDYNALTFENGVATFFYNSIEDDKTVNFCFIKNNSMVCFDFTNTYNPDYKNDLMENVITRKKIRLDNIFIQFRAAKVAILGSIHGNK